MKSQTPAYKRKKTICLNAIGKLLKYKIIELEEAMTLVDKTRLAVARQQTNRAEYEDPHSVEYVAPGGFGITHHNNQGKK